MTLGTTMQEPPCFQSTGVATFLVAVSWRLSTTRMISSKFLPVVAGYRRDSFSLLSGPITKTALWKEDQLDQFETELMHYLAVRAIPLASFSSGSIIPYSSATFLFGSAMIGNVNSERLL